MSHSDKENSQKLAVALSELKQYSMDLLSKSRDMEEEQQYLTLLALVNDVGHIITISSAFKE